MLSSPRVFPPAKTSRLSRKLRYFILSQDISEAGLAHVMVRQHPAVPQEIEDRNFCPSRLTQRQCRSKGPLRLCAFALNWDISLTRRRKVAKTQRKRTKNNGRLLFGHTPDRKGAELFSEQVRSGITLISSSII